MKLQERIFGTLKRNILNILSLCLVFSLVIHSYHEDKKLSILEREVDYMGQSIIEYQIESLSEYNIFSNNVKDSLKNNREEISKMRDFFISKIDILDSAIKPEKKRRMLVIKIRKAIMENSSTKNSIRDLTNIAIAIIDYSYHYNIPVSKILAQIKVESNFNIRAESPAGAMGLMQIMPQTMKYIELSLGKRLDPWNIYDNIMAGCFYMSEQLIDFNNNFSYALAAYNWGPTNVRRFNAGQILKMPEETEKYIPLNNMWSEVFKKYGLE